MAHWAWGLPPGLLSTLAPVRFTLLRCTSMILAGCSDIHVGVKTILSWVVPSFCPFVKLCVIQEFGEGDASFKIWVWDAARRPRIKQHLT